MSFVVKDRVKETSTTTGTGTLTLAGAVSGFRSFADIGNGNICPYVILEASESAPTQWEVGIGTYTSAGTTLARTTVLRTSSGGTSAITLASGTHTVICGWSADYAQGSDFAQHSMIPGGRLTLTSGTPVTTSDVTGATSIYYTPYVSNVISLWTGARRQPIEFSEYTLALGTLTSGKPYDVFAYLSSGVLALEMLAWTNDTTRATAITIQDGRYCKSGDKTRLYLGTFYTTSTTTTEDSGGGTTTQTGGKRYLWNMYNRIARPMAVFDSAAWSYASTTYRQANAASGNKVEFIVGLAEDEVSASALLDGYVASNYFSMSVGIGVDSTTTNSAYIGYPFTALASSQFTISSVGTYRGIPGVGRHYLAYLERGHPNTVSMQNTGGLQAMVWA